jgi:DNA-binding CsgD family transcriptional regulator
MSPVPASPADVVRAQRVTRREAEVLDAVRQRLSNAEIAQRLFVSERTVESHIAALLRKLQAPNRRALAEMAESLAEPARAVPPQLSVLTEAGPFVGRDRELGEIVAWLTPATSAGPRASLITGEAGIGKSRLVAELAVVAHDAGAAVLLGQCHEDLGRPYEPFVQALAADLAAVPDVEARRRLGSDGAQLIRLLPGERARFGDLVAARDTDVGLDRVGLHDAVARYLARASRSAPVLLVIEDIHWAPQGTLELVRHLARAGNGRVLLAVTARDTPPELNDELAHALAALQRLPVVRRTALGGLDREGVHALVTTVRAPARAVARDRFVDTVLDQTGGNPLFVRELARALDERAVYAEAVSVPVGLRELFAARFRRLSPDDRAVLDLAAVIGAEFDLALLSAGAGAPRPAVAEVLERAEQAGLIVAVPGRPGRFAFAHGLIRSARYDALPAAGRLRLHRAVADALERQPDADVADLARHWCAAAPLGQPERAVRYARLAAERARSSVALAEAIRHYESALQAESLLADPGPALRCDLLTGYGEALHRIGDPRHREILMEAAALAEDLDVERLGRVVFALNEHGWASRIGSLDEAVTGMAEKALEAAGPGPSATRARLLAILAAEFHLTRHDKRRLPLAREALAIARHLGNRTVLAEILVCCHWAGFEPDNLAERLAIANEIIALGEAIGDRSLVLQGHTCRYVDSLEGGRAEFADGELALMVRMARELELPFFLVRVLRAHARRAAQAGRFDEADRLQKEILALGQETGLGYVETVASHVSALVDMDRGPRPETLEHLERAAEERSGFRLPQAVLAELLLAAGREDEARAHVADIGRGGFGEVPRNISWLATLSLCGHVAALTRDQDACPVLYRLLGPYSGRVGWSGFPVYSVDLVLGCLAAVIGEPDAALRYLESAESLAGRMGAATHVARARLHRAALGADDDLGTDLAARASANAALEEMVAVGAKGVLTEARLLGLVG